VTDALHLTHRDTAVVQALVQKVRLFSQRQIADHWWNGELSNARRRLKRLANQGLIARMTVQARPVPKIDAPLFRWQPGRPAPDCGQIAYRCQSRFRHRPTRLCTVWIATEQASRLFGGVGRGELKHPTQATHDLGVAAVWLRFAQSAPEWADTWRSEDLLAHTRRGEKLPDAFLVDPFDKVLCVVEFGGGYDADRVRAFHEDCMRRDLPYQLW
jgi:hypothetical protein